MANGLTEPPVLSGLRHPGSLENLGFSPKCLKVVLLYGAEGESVKGGGGGASAEVQVCLKVPGGVSRGGVSGGCGGVEVC